MRVATIKRVILTCVLITLTSRSTVGFATPQDFEGWLLINSHIALDEQKRFQIYLEEQPRVGNNWRRAATNQIRAAINYNPTNEIGLYLGYAWTPAFYDADYHHDYRDEQRFWQQLGYKHDLFGIKWFHRLRQEQRLITRTDGVLNRSRYLLRGSYGLTPSGDFGLTGFDELMVNLNGIDNGPSGGYDRNRIFFGPYWLVGTSRYEVGYLGEHLKQFGDDARWAHAVFAIISYNF